MDEYIAQLYKLFTRSNLAESQKMLIFLGGLRPELRDFTILSKSQNLQEASRFAKTKESLPDDNITSLTARLNVLSKHDLDIQAKNEGKIFEFMDNIKDSITELNKKLENMNRT